MVSGSYVSLSVGVPPLIAHSYPPPHLHALKQALHEQDEAARPHSYPEHAHMQRQGVCEVGSMPPHPSHPSTAAPTPDDASLTQALARNANTPAAQHSAHTHHSAATHSAHTCDQSGRSSTSPSATSSLQYPCRLRRSGTGGYDRMCEVAAGERSLAEMLHGGCQGAASAHGEYSARRQSCAAAVVENEPQFSMSPNAQSSSSPPVEEPAAARSAAAVAADVATTASATTSIPAPVATRVARTPAQQEQIDRANLIGVIACTLEQLCPLTDVLPTDPHYLSLFHTSALPAISIRDYLGRLASYTAVSSECLVQACIHILTLARNGHAEVERRRAGCFSPYNDRLQSPVSPASSVASASSSVSLASPRLPFHPRINSFSSQPFLVSAYNIHRLLLTAMLVTAKMVDDSFFNNKCYATLGGISLKELNRLECEFLAMKEYKLYLSASTFLHEWSVMNSACSHGSWCTRPGHPLGPVIEVHPEDPDLSSDDADGASSVGSSVGELDVGAFQISPNAEAAAEEEEKAFSSVVSETHQQAADVSREVTDVRMQDSRHSSATSTPLYEYSYGTLPSTSPPAEYVSEVVEMPIDPADAQVYQGGWATVPRHPCASHPMHPSDAAHPFHAATMYASLHEFYAHEPAPVKPFHHHASHHSVHFQSSSPQSAVGCAMMD